MDAVASHERYHLETSYLGGPRFATMNYRQNPASYWTVRLVAGPETRQRLRAQVAAARKEQRNQQNDASHSHLSQGTPRGDAAAKRHFNSDTGMVRSVQGSVAR
jgi:hypothetical protein